MKAWVSYAVAGLVVTLVGAGIALLLVEADARSGVWFAAGVAYALQLLSFALLVAVREKTKLFLAGWLGGLVLRFSVIGAVAFWLSRRSVLPLAPTLLSLVTFVFLLLLMEPLFLRRGLQTR